MRRCPTGNDPSTVATDETDCTDKVAHGGFGTGAQHNKCHVDCSNRGACDYSTGKCKCFTGFAGTDCGTKVVWGGHYAPKKKQN